ncbi:MAG: hypothetical protein PVG39_25835 [Desulfobacteraceae bacterium]
MYSRVVNGKVLDYKFKKTAMNFAYVFYLGDILIGTVYRMKKGRWCCVSHKKR